MQRQAAAKEAEVEGTVVGAVVVVVEAVEQNHQENTDAASRSWGTTPLKLVVWKMQVCS